MALPLTVVFELTGGWDSLTDAGIGAGDQTGANAIIISPLTTAIEWHSNPDTDPAFGHPVAADTVFSIGLTNALRIPDIVDAFRIQGTAGNDVVITLW